MSPLLELDRDDDVVREILAPLARVQPVTLRRSPPLRRRSPRRLVGAAVVAVAMLLLGGLALAGAFGPLHGASLQPSPPTLPSPAGSDLACRLIGQPAGKAEALLRQSGYQLEWRFQHWGTQGAQSSNKTTPGAVTGGYTTAPATVPPDSIVWDITADDRSPDSLFVFVEAPNDPNAPAITPPTCQNADG